MRRCFSSTVTRLASVGCAVMTGRTRSCSSSVADLGRGHLGGRRIREHPRERASEELVAALGLDLPPAAHGGVLLGDAEQLEPDPLHLERPGQQLGAQLVRGPLAAQHRLDLRGALPHQREHELAQELEHLVGVVGRAGGHGVGRLGQLGGGERFQRHLAHTTRSRSGFPLKKS